MKNENIRHLEWIYDRMIGIHEENPNYDYMLKMKSILDNEKEINEPNINGNLNSILDMLHDFRNWNRDWDVYSSKNPQNVDEFAYSLSKKYNVTRIG